jgi:hypothetical protein
LRCRAIVVGGLLRTEAKATGGLLPRRARIRRKRIWNRCNLPCFH